MLFMLMQRGFVGMDVLKRQIHHHLRKPHLVGTQKFDLYLERLPWAKNEISRTIYSSPTGYSLCQWRKYTKPIQISSNQQTEGRRRRVRIKSSDLYLQNISCFLLNVLSDRNKAKRLWIKCRYPFL